MTTWRPPISIRDDGPCVMRRHSGLGLAVLLLRATGIRWDVDGDAATGPRDLSLSRVPGGWVARWLPSWSVAGWVGRSTTAAGALRALADVLDTARCPGYERELSGVIRVLNKINKPKEAA